MTILASKPQVLWELSLKKLKNNFSSNLWLYWMKGLNHSLWFKLQYLWYLKQSSRNTRIKHTKRSAKRYTRPHGTLKFGAKCCERSTMRMHSHSRHIFYFALPDMISTKMRIWFHTGTNWRLTVFVWVWCGQTW